jgi:hypothetical protein
MSREIWDAMMPEARALFVALVREANPDERLPADEDAVYEACCHNWTDRYATDAEAALHDAAALAELRTQLGLPVFS